MATKKKTDERSQVATAYDISKLLKRISDLEVQLPTADEWQLLRNQVQCLFNEMDDQKVETIRAATPKSDLNFIQKLFELLGTDGYQQTLETVDGIQKAWQEHKRLRRKIVGAVTGCENVAMTDEALVERIKASDTAKLTQWGAFAYHVRCLLKTPLDRDTPQSTQEVLLEAIKALKKERDELARKRPAVSVDDTDTELLDDAREFFQRLQVVMSIPRVAPMTKRNLADTLTYIRQFMSLDVSRDRLEQMKATMLDIESTPPDRTLWREYFKVAINKGFTRESAVTWADEMLSIEKKRWEK